MTTELLRAALIEYLNNHHELSMDDRDQIRHAAFDLDEIDLRAGSNDPWKHEVYVQHSETVSDLMNYTTYDIYGRLYAIHHGRVTYADYYQMVRQYYPSLTTADIDLGFDIVSDLYAENQKQGCHKLDGTFNHDSEKGSIGPENTPAAHELKRLRRFLDAYKLTNAGYLDAGDEYELSAAITYVSVLMRHADELDRMTAND